MARWRDVRVGLLIFLVVAAGTMSFAQLPPSTGAPAVGQKAPNFTLPDQHGKMVSLSGLLKSKETPKLKGIVLIFYRGYW
jgi:cytochrome oxidase Cu insertion factor (SCO1/SenC/PrrC family)